MATPSHDQIRTRLEQFLAQTPPPEVLRELDLALATTLPRVHPTAWIPPAEEIEIRLSLARRLLENIRNLYLDPAYQFSAVQVSALLHLPLDTLRRWVDTDPFSVEHQMDAISDLIFYCESFGFSPFPFIILLIIEKVLRAQHPAARSHKRKAPHDDSGTGGPNISSKPKNRSEKEEAKVYTHRQR